MDPVHLVRQQALDSFAVFDLRGDIRQSGDALALRSRFTSIRMGCWEGPWFSSRRRRLHSTNLRQRRLGLRQPQGHVHGAIHLDGGSQRRPSLLALTCPDMKGDESVRELADLKPPPLIFVYETVCDRTHPKKQSFSHVVWYDAKRKPSLAR